MTALRLMSGLRLRCATAAGRGDEAGRGHPPPRAAVARAARHSPRPAPGAQLQAFVDVKCAGKAPGATDLQCPFKEAWGEAGFLESKAEFDAALRAEPPLPLFSLGEQVAAADAPGGDGSRFLVFHSHLAEAGEAVKARRQLPLPQPLPPPGPLRPDRPGSPATPALPTRPSRPPPCPPAEAARAPAATAAVLHRRRLGH